MLRDALAAGEFAVTAELGPPLDPDAERVRDTARALAGVVHAANVTDNQAATVKTSPLACSVWMIEEGLEPILQLTTRDRNVLALQADLLGGVGAGRPLDPGPLGRPATGREVRVDHETCLRSRFARPDATGRRAQRRSARGR